MSRTPCWKARWRFPKKYGVELDGLMLHITDLLGRFRNAALKDTCKRVGGDRRGSSARPTA